MGAAACVVVPSRREGHGMVAAEAAAAGTPVVAVNAPDSALTDLVEEGVNGAVAPSAAPEDLAAAIGRVLDGGPALRARTAEWWEEHRAELSAHGSIERVRALYGEITAGPGGRG
jgi:glycosyltransferase involved in cell wall biosynthesis